MWRWLAARRGGAGPPRAGHGSVVDDALRRRLAYWRGNVAAVHRELVAAAAAGGPAAPSSSPRCTARSPVTHVAGERAGLRKGEQAPAGSTCSCSGRVAPQRRVGGRPCGGPGGGRRGGRPLKPWVTWFIDAATTCLRCGGHAGSRTGRRPGRVAGGDQREPYGPFGGLPEVVRVDRGKDFLSRTVCGAGCFRGEGRGSAAYIPHLKGTVEGFNRAVEKMLFAVFPGIPAGRAGQRASGRSGEPALSFEDFVDALLAWVRWWNTEHACSGWGIDPLEAWLADPTPLHDAGETGCGCSLWKTTGEDGRSPRRGWRGAAAIRRRWMAGQVGPKVRVRYMPHHDHRDRGLRRRYRPAPGRRGAGRAATAEIAERVGGRAPARRAGWRRTCARPKSPPGRYAAATAPEPAAAAGRGYPGRGGRDPGDAARRRSGAAATGAASPPGCAAGALAAPGDLGRQPGTASSRGAGGRRLTPPPTRLDRG